MGCCCRIDLNASLIDAEELDILVMLLHELAKHLENTNLFIPNMMFYLISDDWGIEI